MPDSPPAPAAADQGEDERWTISVCPECGARQMWFVADVEMATPAPAHCSDDHPLTSCEFIEVVPASKLDAAIAERDEQKRINEFDIGVALAETRAQLRDQEQAIRDAADWMEYEAADPDPEHDAHTAHSEAFHACARKARSALGDVK